MKILKSVTINLSKIPEKLTRWTITIGDITIQTHPNKSEKSVEYLIVSAQKELYQLPRKTSNNLIVLPENELKSIEQSIELIANHLSLCENLQRSISSMSPSIFLVASSDEEQEYLEGVKGFDLSNVDRINKETKRTLDLEFCIKNLGDRPDGVLIFSEANSCTHLSGKFHEYIRLFERAFNRSNRGIIDPLSNFLKQNEILGYSKSEIEKWVDIRHKSIHANSPEGFLVEGDLRPYISRVEQACYDVLFKEDMAK